MSKLENSENQLITISLAKCSNSDRYGICLNSSHKYYKELRQKFYNSELLKLFINLSSKTWQEAYNTPRINNFGYEHLKISAISDANIAKLLKELSSSDKCDIFRFGNKQFRACGYRENNVFYLVCCDYDHSLYEH